MQRRILLIEDDASGRELALFNLKKAGYEVVGTSSGDEGLEYIESEIFHLVITDVKMPGISGIEVLKRIKKMYPSIPVIIITAYANVEMAVEAMKLGAEDFLGKPFGREHLLMVVKKSLSYLELRTELANLRRAVKGVERPIIYTSSQMEKTVSMADKFAVSDASVLVTGESGTGKELIARRIHAKSNRSEKPFIPVNLAAIPNELLEAELFGFKKGAFTGAVKDRLGKFRVAEGGTLFLDEISELPFVLQGKLLRALQEKVIDVLGSDTPIPVDVRIVAATNKHLEKEVANERFRQDLFFRINVVQVDIPPLRERPDDIAALAFHFVNNLSKGRTLEIPRDVEDALMRHTWPGNARELENVCQRLILLATSDKVSVEDLPFSNTQDANINQLNEITFSKEGISLMDIEKQIIEKVLTMQNGNVSKTASYLHIPRHVLAYRMEKFGITKK